MCGIREEKQMIEKCKYCGYEGETHYYRRKHHCIKCNRLVGKDLEDYENGKTINNSRCSYNY